MHKHGFMIIKHGADSKQRQDKTSTAHIWVFSEHLTSGQVYSSQENSWMGWRSQMIFFCQLQGRGNLLWHKLELAGGLTQYVSAQLKMSNSKGLWKQPEVSHTVIRRVLKASCGDHVKSLNIVSLSTGRNFSCVKISPFWGRWLQASNYYQDLGLFTFQKHKWNHNFTIKKKLPCT